MKKQLSILPLVPLVATLACTLNAPPGAPERNLLMEAPVTVYHSHRRTPGDANGQPIRPPIVTPEYRITETRTCEVNTLALNVRNGHGSFYIELVGNWDLCKQDLVLVTGNVYCKFIRNRERVRFHAKQVSLLERERPCNKAVA